MSWAARDVYQYTFQNGAKYLITVRHLWELEDWEFRPSESYAGYDLLANALEVTVHDGRLIQLRP